MTIQENQIQPDQTIAVLYHPSWSLSGGDCRDIGKDISMPAKIISHSELQYGENIFFQWCYNATNIRESTKKINRYRLKKQLFFKFTLILNANESAKLTEEITKYNSNENSCMGSVSAVLQNATHVSIPYPISQLPTLSAAYLTSKFILGKLKFIKPQVKSIECSISSSWRTIGNMVFFGCVETAAIPLMIARRGTLAGISAIKRGFRCMQKTIHLARCIYAAKERPVLYTEKQLEESGNS